MARVTFVPSRFLYECRQPQHDDKYTRGEMLSHYASMHLLTEQEAEVLVSWGEQLESMYQHGGEIISTEADPRRQAGEVVLHD